jgi:hypothetical protein
MKTRVLSIKQLFTTFLVCLSFQSCNKDDFYQKEYLDNPFQGSSTNGSGTNGSQGGGYTGTNGGVQGGVSGNTVAGTNGSSTTGTTSGGSDGLSTGGSTTGGVDGSTTSGSTTGGTAGGVDGSTTGSTSGGTTGGGVGSTSGGSTGAIYQVDQFRQSASQSRKLDIIWIIDNSGSMMDEQSALGANFSAFIDDFITKNIDFKMAITTTDTSSSLKKGLMVKGSDSKLTSQMAKLNEFQFKSDFTNLVKVGTAGSGYEKGLEASEGFMQKYSGSFLRPDAYLAIVIVSDEEDQSPKAVSQYTDYLKSFKQETGLIKLYSIVDVNKTNCCQYGVTTGGDRYILASTKTAGVVGDIRNDFFGTLSSMGDTLIRLLDSFALSKKPIEGSLKVYVDGLQSQDYIYDRTTNSIKFDQNRLPTEGAAISVSYIINE